jgi:hypothetical protein
VDVQDVIDVDTSDTAYGHEMNVVEKKNQVLENEIANLVHPLFLSCSIMLFLTVIAEVGASNARKKIQKLARRPFFQVVSSDVASIEQHP